LQSNSKVFKNPFCALCHGADISDLNKQSASPYYQVDHVDGLPEVDDASRGVY